MMLVWVAAGYFFGKYGFSNSSGLSKTTALLLLLLFIPTFLLVIAVHEMGHAVAGVQVNFDFKMYVVGPFMWNKENGQWKFSWNKNVNTAGGLVLCLPTDTVNLKRKFAIFALGGPFFSLLLATVCYLVAQLLKFEMAAASVAQQVLKSSLYILAGLSFLIFIVTIIPMHTGGFSSDGGRALRLLSGGDSARFEVLLLKMISVSAAGTRPGKLNLAELIEARQLADKLNAPFGIYITNYFHQVAWDKGDIAEAEQHLLAYIDGSHQIPEGIRNTVWLDASIFYALAKSDALLAEKYWNHYKPTAMIPKAQVLAAEAALHFVRNEHALAKPKLEAALLELPYMMDKGVAIPLQERLVWMQENIELKKA